MHTGLQSESLKGQDHITDFDID